MNMDTTPSYSTATTVQLVCRHGDVRPGTLGRIIGRFARENETYLVSFGPQGVVEVTDDEITTAKTDADADRALHRSRFED